MKNDIFMGFDLFEIIYIFVLLTLALFSLIKTNYFRNRKCIEHTIIKNIITIFEKDDCDKSSQLEIELNKIKSQMKYLNFDLYNIYNLLEFFFTIIKPSKKRYYFRKVNPETVKKIYDYMINLKLNNPYIILPPDYECFFSTIEDYIHANNISQSTKTLRNFAAFISANKTTRKGIITIDTLCKILTVFGFIIGMISIAK